MHSAKASGYKNCRGCPPKSGFRSILSLSTESFRFSINERGEKGTEGGRPHLENSAAIYKTLSLS